MGMECKVPELHLLNPASRLGSCDVQQYGDKSMKLTIIEIESMNITIT